MHATLTRLVFNRERERAAEGQGSVVTRVPPFKVAMSCIHVHALVRNRSSRRRRVWRKLRAAFVGGFYIGGSLNNPPICQYKFSANISSYNVYGSWKTQAQNWTGAYAFVAWVQMPHTIRWHSYNVGPMGAQGMPMQTTTISTPSIIRARVQSV